MELAITTSFMRIGADIADGIPFAFVRDLGGMSTCAAYHHHPYPLTLTR
jgi:hypothetical protein